VVHPGISAGKPDISGLIPVAAARQSLYGKSPSLATAFHKSMPPKMGQLIFSHYFCVQQ
jgi:hypothetical protein